MGDIGSYVINLDRSSERWQAIERQAQINGVSLTRIAGIDGCSIDARSRKNIDELKFVRNNGRRLLPGEYGCYLAHLKALRTFLDSDHKAAVIFEDDVEIAFDILPRVRAIHEAIPSADVVKLLSHRTKGFREVAKTIHDDRVGRCLHGPQGSAACYFVTRQGAEKLLKKLEQIEFPFDVSLERGWSTGVNVFTVQNNMLELSPRAQDSQIASRDEYRKFKVYGARKIVTHVRRAIEYAKRIRYALS